MVREILVYPNKKLREVSKKVTIFDASLHALLDDMYDTMIFKEGINIYCEGCLSVPGYYEDVELAEHIKLSYQDRFGNIHEEEFKGLMAIAVQHEMDHLNGRLFIEKLSYLKRKKFEKECKKNKKAGK